MAFTPSLNIDWEPLFLSTLRDFSQILGRLVWFPGWNCNTNGAECLVAADKPVNRVSGSPGKHESARPWHPWHWAPGETWPVAEVNTGRQASRADTGRWGGQAAGSWARAGEGLPGCPHDPHTTTLHPSQQSRSSPFGSDHKGWNLTTWELISCWFW